MQVDILMFMGIHMDITMNMIILTKITSRIFPFCLHDRYGKLLWPFTQNEFITRCFNCEHTDCQ